MEWELSLVLLLGLAVYFAPAIVASWRNHPNATAIFALNLLLGATGVGWVAALVWALTAIKPEAAPPPAEPYREL